MKSNWRNWEISRRKLEGSDKEGLLHLLARQDGL